MAVQALLVFIGAGLGAVLRWRIGAWSAHLWPAFPPGTLIVNLAGSFLIGLAAGCFEVMPEIPKETRLLVTTGFLGGFTTFSAFSLETASLLPERPLFALAMVSGKLLACLALTYAGLVLGKKLAGAL